jgi:putative heme utilization carrier protein HutX
LPEKGKKMNDYLAEFTEKKKTVRAISREHNVPELEVLKVLASGNNVRLLGKEFVRPLLQDLQLLGEVPILIEKDGSIFEIKSIFPAGKESDGYYNLARAPFSGHLNIEAIEHIAVVDEIFFNLRSCSWFLLNAAGSVIFKVYVARNPDKTHIKEQMDIFEKWKNV